MEMRTQIRNVKQDMANARAAQLIEEAIAPSNPVSGAALPSSCFLWVGNPKDRSTWRIPYRTHEHGPADPVVVGLLNAAVSKKTIQFPAEISAKLKRILRRGTSQITSAKSTRDIEVVNFDRQFVEAKMDKSVCVVKHVAIMKSTSSGSSYPGSRGRRYTETALRSCMTLSEGCKSYWDHQDSDEKYTMGGIRKVGDLIGFFEGCSLEGDTVYGDLHYLRDTMTRERLEAIVEQMADKIGMSIHALGTAWYDPEDQMEVVDDIKAMRSIDVVTEPGSTKNLFESRSDGGAVGDDPEDGDDTAQEGQMEYSTLTLADLQEHRPDLVKTVEESIKSDQTKAGELASLRGQVADLTEKNTKLAAKVDTYEVEKKLREREVQIEVLVKESGLPADVVTVPFRESLRNAKDDAAVKVLLEDRKKLVLKTTGGVRDMGAESTTVTEAKGGTPVPDAEAVKDYEEAAKG